MRKAWLSVLAGVFLICTVGAAGAEPAGALRKNGVRKKPEVALLKSMEADDVACYVTLVDAEGGESTHMADFEVCEMDHLLGQQVQVKRGRAKVMAESCQDSQDCPANDRGRIIKKLNALP